MDTNKKLRDHISALMDGALPDADLELAMAALEQDDGVATWKRYHQIGDALRALPVPALSEGFEAQLAARLAHEPLATRRASAASAAATGLASVLPDPAAP